MKITKTARYHDATNNRYHLHFSCHLPWNSSKRLNTTMLQITCVISFFRSISPWKSPKRLSTMMLQITDFLSTCFMVAPMKFMKTAQYHEATNNMHHLIFSWHAPWNSPKRLSTTMLQTTDAISMFPCYFQWNATKQLSTTMPQMTGII